MKKYILLALSLISFTSLPSFSADRKCEFIDMMMCGDAAIRVQCQGYGESAVYLKTDQKVTLVQFDLLRGRNESRENKLYWKFERILQKNIAEILAPTASLPAYNVVAVDFGTKIFTKSLKKKDLKKESRPAVLQALKDVQVAAESSRVEVKKDQEISVGQFSIAKEAPVYKDCETSHGLAEPNGD